jgi:phage gp46-like protein
MIENPCITENIGRRRLFWTTRQKACGKYTVCGMECDIPGLEYEDHEEPDVSPDQAGRTIKTDEWVNSLVLNILNTRARNDMRCPTPAGTFGHWSESYREDGLYIGSTLWNAAEKSYIRVADAVKAIKAAVQADMGKLIAMGIASMVEVEAYYLGANSVKVEVEVTTQTGRSRINLSGAFVTETWIWQ